MSRIFSDDSSSEEDKGGFKSLFSTKNILFLLLIAICLNLVFLDILVFKGLGVKTIENVVSENKEPSLGKEACGKDCIDKINEAINQALKPTISLSQTITPTPSITKTQSYSSNIQPVTKEYYIPFGAGSGSSSDWQDVAGLQAYIDSTSYVNIKSVVFEASLHVPTGNQTASVRLYNATDGHPVWNSEINFNGNTSSVFLNSQGVSLDLGNKLYKVQMKTQLQFTAVLDQSRLHIITK